MRLTNNLSFEQIKQLAQRKHRLVYALQTCWWKLGDPCYTTSSEHGRLPCGPRGEMLLETDNPLAFIKAAEDNPEHYGRNGLDAFAAAYDGNLVTDTGAPTSFNSWDDYNALIDLQRGGIGLSSEGGPDAG